MSIAIPQKDAKDPIQHLMMALYRAFKFKEYYLFALI